GDPLLAGESETEILADGRQRDDDHARVDERERRTQDRCEQRQPAGGLGVHLGGTVMWCLASGLVSGLPPLRRWIATRRPESSIAWTSQGRPSTEERPSSAPTSGSSPSWRPRWISRPSESSRIQIASASSPSSAGAAPPAAQTFCGSKVGCSRRVTSRRACRSSSDVGLPQNQKPHQTPWIRRAESRTKVSGR